MADQAQNDQDGERISGNLALCAFVEKSHLFRKVDPADMGQVFQSGRLHRFLAGQLILCEGKPGDRLFLVVQGSVRVYAQGAQGPVELGRLARGGIFGEVGFLTGKPRAASVQALDAVEAISFGRRELTSLLRKYPKIIKLIKATMSARAQQAIEKTIS